MPSLAAVPSTLEWGLQKSRGLNSMRSFAVSSLVVALQLLSDLVAITALTVPQLNPLSLSNQSNSANGLSLSPAKALFDLQPRLYSTMPTLSLGACQTPLTPPTRSPPPIPVAELLQSLASSLQIIFNQIGAKGGNTELDHGFFRHRHRFDNDDEVTILILDFGAIGKTISYYRLLDVVRGVGEFMELPERTFTVVEFEVHVKMDGRLEYVTTGSVRFKKVGG